MMNSQEPSNINVSRKSIEENEMHSFELLAQAAVGITVYQGDDLIVLVANQSACEIWGKSQEDLIGKPVLEISPELESSPTYHIVREVLKTGVPFEGREVPIEFIRSGQLYKGYFDVVYTAWKGQQGEIKGVITVYTEVTHSVIARKKIEEKEERFRSTFENAAVGIAHVGIDGTWLMVNDRLCEIAGYTREELLAKTFQEITHPNDLDADLHFVDDLLSGRLNTYSMEKRYIRKNGSFVWANLTVSMAKKTDGEPDYFIAVIQDISEQKRAEEAVKQSEEQFRTLADNIQNLAWMADSAGTVFWYNQRWYEYTGIAPQQMDNKSWETFLHPQHIDQVNQLKTALRQQEPFELTFPLLRFDGNYRWFLTRVYPIKSAGGEVLRWVGTSTDIDEHKSVEEKLENLVAERTRQLRRSNEELQQFAHVASHDFKEPVRKIRFFSGHLSNEYGQLLPEKGMNYLNKIQDASARIYEMIDAILLYSSFGENDKLNERVNLTSVINQIISDLEVVIHEKDAKIAFTELPVIEGSPVLMYQLFSNLINNSLKFSKPNVTPVITISWEQAGNNTIQITLQDNGIGFKEQNANIIFKAFSRLHSKSEFQGTGLGLSLCQRIVERHGGEIYAHGEEGIGALFVIKLPVKQIES